MHGEVVHRQRCSGGVRNPVRDRENPRLVADGELGKTSTTGKRRDAVPRLQGATVRYGPDDAGDLGAGSERQRWLHLVLAARHQQVRERYAGRVHLDKDLAAGSSRLRNVDDLDRRRTLEGGDPYRLHRVLLLGCCLLRVRAAHPAGYGTPARAERPAAAAAPRRAGGAVIWKIAGVDSLARDFPTFVELLTLEFIEEDIFRGQCHQGAPLRAFGGQVAAQSLVAAGRTVADHQVHSLHGYFMRPGDPRRPIVYHVDRIRNGRSFTTRRVTAIQHGEAIFSLSASFQKREEGVEHQFAMPQVPDPDELQSFRRGRQD